MCDVSNRPDDPTTNFGQEQRHPIMCHIKGMDDLSPMFLQSKKKSYVSCFLSCCFIVYMSTLFNNGKKKIDALWIYNTAFTVVTLESWHYNTPQLNDLVQTKHRQMMHKFFFIEWFISFLKIEITTKPKQP